MKKIYTVGYEGKTFEEFIGILKDKGIRHLVDVRSSPHSSRSEFSGDNLKSNLFKKGIVYKHLEALGGLDVEDYREKMKTLEWKEAFYKLEDFSIDVPTVMMCLEKDPSRCHRRFISERLEEKGWEVIHLGKGGSWKGSTLDDY